MPRMQVRAHSAVSPLLILFISSLSATTRLLTHGATISSLMYATSWCHLHKSWNASAHELVARLIAGCSGAFVVQYSTLSSILMKATSSCTVYWSPNRGPNAIRAPTCAQYDYWVVHSTSQASTTDSSAQSLTCGVDGA
jgi:hypothetical protein